VAQLVEEARDQPAHLPHPIGPPRRRGAADPGDVEADDAGARRQRVDERLQPFEADAQPVHQQQCRPAAVAFADRHPHALTSHRHELGGARRAGRGALVDRHALARIPADPLDHANRRV
jgi:hypothetical protein